MRLENKVAIITGGAGLVGPSFMEGLIKNGAFVILADSNEAKLKDVKNGFKNVDDNRLSTFILDISKEESWLAIRKWAINRYGKIDILVNNAAITNQSKSKNYDKNFFDYPLDDWNAIMDVNLTGTFLGCQVIGRTMTEQGFGSIINIASFYGVQSPHHKMYPGTGIFQPPAYMVSKAGVIALTKYLATYLGESGVRVNCISPGGIFNGHSGLFLERFGNLNPMGRMAKKEEMVGALLYLASDESSYVNGHNLIVDGGWSVW